MPRKMVTIFSVFKYSLIEMGIDYENSIRSILINAGVFLVLIFWFLNLVTGIIVESNNLSLVIICFFAAITSLFNITTYTYILCHKSKLLQLIDELETSIHGSKCLIELLNGRKDWTNSYLLHVLYISDIINPDVVNKFEKFNESFDKYHSMAGKCPVSIK